MVVSGYELENLPDELRAAPFVAKPISMPVLMEAIQGATVRAGREPSTQSVA